MAMFSIPIEISPLPPTAVETPSSDVNNPLLPINVPGGPEKTPHMLQAIISNGLIIFLIGGAVIFFFTFLWGGIAYMTAGGDKERRVSATSRLTNAFIGLFVIFLIFVIMSLISSIFGYHLLNFSIPRF